MSDQIVLTLPAERDFHRVAHLIVGGLAIRQDLTFEHLEDLQLALDGLLEHAREGEEVTVALTVGAGTIRTAVGPFSDGIRTELARDELGELGLSRVLETLCDGFETSERDDGLWIELTKTIGERNGDG